MAIWITFYLIIFWLYLNIKDIWVILAKYNLSSTPEASYFMFAILFNFGLTFPVFLVFKICSLPANIEEFYIIQYNSSLFE